LIKFKRNLDPKDQNSKNRLAVWGDDLMSGAGKPRRFEKGGGGRGRNDDRGHKGNSSAKVFVGNLSYKTAWQDLKDYMRTAGEVVFAEVFSDAKGYSKGCG
jgi:RNA recognition motif-containing protein